MRLEFKIFAMFAVAFGVMMAFGGRPDVWQCRKPDADALIYLNTGQAERHMDHELWNRIQQDKKSPKGLAEEDHEEGELEFDLFKKDVELVLNVDVVAKKPLRLVISGGMTYEADEKGVVSNCIAMISDVVNDGNGKYVRTGGQRHPVHEFTMQLNEEESVHVKIAEEDAFVRFEILYNIDELPSGKEVVPPLSRQQSMSNIKSGDSAIGMVLNTSAWAGVFRGRTKDVRVLNRLLRAMETVELRVRVDGIMIEVALRGVFKSEELAGRYSKDLLDSLPAVSQALDGGILAELKPGINGSVVTISAKARLDLAWESMMKLNANMAEANMTPQNVVPAPNP